MNNNKLIYLPKDSIGDNWNESIRFYNQWVEGASQFELTTSGSTGPSKSIIISRKQMEISAQQTIDALQLFKGDKLLVCINTAFIGGKMMLVRGLMNDMPLYITEPSSNPLKDLTHHFDFIAVVPLQMQTMLEENEFLKLNKMKAIIVGGAAINQTLLKEIEKLKVPIYATYGMTETVSHIALKRLNGDHKSNYFKTIGDISIKCDSRNCLIIRGSVTNNEEIITNDVVNIIGETKFELVGRFDNIINSGGIKVNPEKVEEMIEILFNQLNIKNRFFITGLPDGKLGECVSLIVEGVEFNTSELTQKISHTLDKYHQPKFISFINRFAETSTGKINRKETILVL